MANSIYESTGDGSTTDFTIPFSYLEEDDITAFVDGVSTSFTFTSDNIVSFTTAPANNSAVRILRNTDLDSLNTTYSDGGALTAKQLNDSNTQLLYGVQEAIDTANEALSLDNDGKFDAEVSGTNRVIKNTADPTNAQDVATKNYVDTGVTSQLNQATTQATNAANSATSASSNATASAASASAASTSATNASNSATSAATSATTATTQATNASTSASNAATSETNAATSETNAATSESNAATSATNAATSATNAANSASAAEATFDLFDDAYLGAKASDPSVDNDGNALQDGALYFDTTNNVMKVYDLGNTTWFQLTPTVSNQTNINTVAGISSDITAVAGDATDIGTVATDLAGSDNIGTVAGAISNVNAVGTDIASVNTVATNISDVNNFADTYFIGATAPASPTLGDLWFDTANDVMKVYSSGGFINAGSAVNGTANRYNWTVGTADGAYTGSTTVFPADYDSGYVDVYLNGVKLVVTDDFTATNGTSVTLTTAASSGDTVDIVGYGTFTATTALSLGDNEKVQFGAGNDLQIYHDGTNSVFKDAGTGHAKFIAGDFLVKNAADTEIMLKATSNGAVDLYHNGGKRTETTSTGTRTLGNGDGYANLELDTNTADKGHWRFQANSNPATATLNVENFAGGSWNTRFFVNQSGDVVVGGTTLDGATSTTIYSGGQIRANTSGQNVAILDRRDSDGSILEFKKDDTTGGSIGVRGGDLYVSSDTVGLRFRDSINSIVPSLNGNVSSDATFNLGNDTNRFKNLYLSGGVYLGGTGSANKLDDYEEGTFNPIFENQTGIVYGEQTGRYTKIGRMVYYYIRVYTTTMPSGQTGDVEISGLPYTSNSAPTQYLANFRAYRMGTNRELIWAYVPNNQTELHFYRGTNQFTSDTGLTRLTYGDFFVAGSSNKNIFVISGMYETA